MTLIADLKQRAETLVKHPPEEPAAPAAPRPFPKSVGPAEAMVDVIGLAGPAMVLNNGDFVRLLEVAPVDLEQGNQALKERYWAMFGGALRRLRAPMNLQFVVLSQPQDLTLCLQRWQTQAQEWDALAEATTDADLQKRRHTLAERARAHAAFEAETQARLMPMQQRYLVAITLNPLLGAGKKTSVQTIDRVATARALEQLDQRVQTVQAALSDLGLAVCDVPPAEMAQILWHYYHHPASLLGSQLSPLAALEPGRADVFRAARDVQDGGCPSIEQVQAVELDAPALAYLLAPEMIEETEGYVRVGDVLARGYEIYDFDPRVPVDFSAILAFPGDVTHAIFLEAADPAELRRLYRDRETELKAANIVDGRRGAVADHGRTAAIVSLESARADMEVALEAPFFLRWTAVLWANDPASLDRKSQQFETQLKLRDLRFRRTTRRHLSAVQAARPVGRLVYNVQPRNMSADSLSSFFPFIRREFLDPAGWPYGVHRGNGLAIWLDPFEGGRANATELAIGSPRSGKSVYLKQEIEALLALGHRVFVIDPEREYLSLAVDHHAPYIELGKRGTPRLLPPLDPRQPGSLGAAMVELEHLYEDLAGESLEPDAQEPLLAAYAAALQAGGIDPADARTWGRPQPPLADVVSRVVSAAPEVARVLGYAVALEGGNVLNIMELNPDSENAWSAAAEQLAAFVEAILNARLDSAAFNALVEAYQQTMTKWGFRRGETVTGQRKAPPLSELVNALRAGADPQGRELAQVLHQYAYGLYADLFNCESNLKIDSSQLVVFGLRSLRETGERNLTPVFVWQILRLVWNQIVAASGSGQPVHLFIDEAWYLLEQPGAALRLERMTRSFPKYQAALHLATHEALKLSISPEVSVIRDLARVKVLFRQESEAAARGLGVFGLTDGEQTSLLRLGKGEGWLLFGDEMHLPIYVAVDPRRLPRLSSNGAQMQAVARASGRKGAPVV